MVNKGYHDQRSPRASVTPSDRHAHRISGHKPGATDAAGTTSPQFTRVGNHKQPAIRRPPYPTALICRFYRLLSTETPFADQGGQNAIGITWVFHCNPSLLKPEKLEQQSQANKTKKPCTQLYFRFNQTTSFFVCSVSIAIVFWHCSAFLSLNARMMASCRRYVPLIYSEGWRDWGYKVFKSSIKDWTIIFIKGFPEISAIAM